MNVRLTTAPVKAAAPIQQDPIPAIVRQVTAYQVTGNIVKVGLALYRKNDI